MTVCTRFAPSPTGDLHLGSARTALYAWLYAKKMQGTFILRIEDTDRERSTDAAIQVIFDGMAWLELDYQGPYFQTKHFDRYREVIQQLVDQGHAYRCYCTKESLAEMRHRQLANKEKPRYDGTCRHRTDFPNDQPFVIRFKNPLEGVVAFDDQIRGLIEFQNSELDDLIIARSDGVPTYNLTVVVDDWDMKITHVIRGEDHINNTPRQINIFRALGATPPLYAHLPMILGSDGKKLSKRQAAVSVMQYRDEGILKEALLNYLVRLGWSHGDQEIFSLDEMISLFDIKNIHHSAAQFNMDKLLWLNQHYMKTLPPQSFEAILQQQFDALGIDTKQGPSLADIIGAQCERAKTLKEMAMQSRYFYESVSTYNEEAIAKHWSAATIEPLKTFRQKLSALTTWNKEAIHAAMNDVVNTFELKFPKLAQPLRIAMTGDTISPSIDLTIYLIGQQRAVERIDQFLSVVASL